MSLGVMQLLLSVASLVEDYGSDVCFAFLTVCLFSPQDFAG